MILSEYPGVPGSNYINANYVRGSSGNQRAYIASQGPLPNTLIDFWRMIWETEVLVIVMACNEREAGKYKCEPYWPCNTDEQQQYGNITGIDTLVLISSINLVDFSVTHIKWRQVCPDFLVRTFKVCADDEERTICQFHYTTWPDHGVPSSVHPIIELVRLMRDVQSTESRPILVHCSAGCGRTGTICSIDYVWALLRTGKLKEDFSLFEIISDMRRQRIAMVQTVEQYMLCYKAVSTLFEQHLKLIDSHTYENIDCDGEPLGIKNFKTDADSNDSENFVSDSSCDSSKLNLSKEQLNSYSEKPENNLNNIEKIETNFLSDQIQSTSLSGSLEEVRPHEKLVGKATVIRRPSIAKLKAIFDNPSSPNDSIEDSCSRESSSFNSSKLQRSQSIKESIRNLNFNFHLEINQPKAQSRKIKSYTLSAAKLSVYKRNLSFANLTFQADKTVSTCSKNSDVNLTASTSNYGHNSDPKSDQVYSDKIQSNSTCRSSPLLSNSPQNSSNSQTQPESNAESDQDYSSQLVISMHQYSKDSNKKSHQASLDDSPPSAPPKPPRTYQHVVDDSCIVRTSEGRLIVSVAQPRQHKIENSFIPINIINSQIASNNSIYEQLGAKKFNISSPNLNFNDQMSFLSSNTAQMNARQAPIRPRFFESENNPNQLYNNAMISKPYPRPIISLNSSQHPASQVSIAPNNHYSSNLTFIDLLSNQHFQHHQAKPIILQPNYYEPIYGTSNRHTFMPTRSSIQPQSSNYQIVPPTRPRSISHGTFHSVSPAQENIYSNREMCFVKANPKPYESHLAINSNVPIVSYNNQSKENVYSEINTLHQTNSTVSNGAVASNSNKDQCNHKANNFKPSPFTKIKNVFKAFKIKGPNSQKGSSKMILQPVKSNTSSNSSSTLSNNLKANSESTINPLNGKIVRN